MGGSELRDIFTHSVTEMWDISVSYVVRSAVSDGVHENVVVYIYKEVQVTCRTKEQGVFFTVISCDLWSLVIFRGRIVYISRVPVNSSPTSICTEL